MGSVPPHPALTAGGPLGALLPGWPEPAQECLNTVPTPGAEPDPVL